ncbi:MAG: TolC family protein [Porphyromonadaceae bacterium]|nr:TolC family protein [Porphyromonadaceae bacterium]
MKPVTCMKKIHTLLPGLLLTGLLLWGTTVKAQEPLVLSQADCRAMALEHNETLQKAENDLRKAELDKYVAFSSYLPSIDATGMGVYLLNDVEMTKVEEMGMGMAMQMKGTYLAGINLIQPIYAGGKIIAGNKLARIGVESADENVRKTRMEVIADADNAYWTYIATRRKIGMLESYCEQMEALYRQVEVSLSAQLATKNDLLRITAKRSEINYQLQKARNGVNLCRLALCNVLGVDFTTEIIPTDTLFETGAAPILDGDISQRPELRLLQKQIDAQEQQIKVTRADMLPTVGLGLGYSYLGNIKMKMASVNTTDGSITQMSSEFKQGFPLGMLSVSIPILHWGANFKKVKKSKYDLLNARLDFQEKSRLLTIEAQQALQNVSESYLMIETAELGLEQAEENLRTMETYYRNQMATLTDLLDAQSQWQQAESNYIEAQTQYKIYETEYLRTTGRLE